MSRRTLLGVLAAPTPTSSRPGDGRGAAQVVPADTDAELIRLCAVVRALEDGDAPGHGGAWDEALRRVSAMRPASVPGLRAKVQLALAMLPYAEATPAWASPDELLLLAVLNDVLALTDPASQA